MPHIAKMLKHAINTENDSNLAPRSGNIVARMSGMLSD